MSYKKRLDAEMAALTKTEIEKAGKKLFPPTTPNKHIGTLGEHGKRALTLEKKKDKEYNRAEVTFKTRTSHGTDAHKKLALRLSILAFDIDFLSEITIMEKQDPFHTISVFEPGKVVLIREGFELYAEEEVGEEETGETESFTLTADPNTKGDTYH